MNAQESLNNYWSGRAEAYHAHQTTSQRAPADQATWRQVIEEYLPAPPGEALDLGTGTGFLARLLSAQGFNTLGVDAAPGMLAVAEEAGGARFMLGDATQLPPSLRFKRFHVITSRYLLWTLPKPAAAVEQWAMMLHPGGMLLAADANWYPEGQVDPQIEVDSKEGPDAFVRTYTPELMGELPLSTATSPEAYAQLFEAAGLEDVQVNWVPEVSANDELFGLSRGHRSRPNFVVTGLAAATA